VEKRVGGLNETMMKISLGSKSRQINIGEAKRTMLIPELLQRLGAPPECIPAREGRNACCPWPQNHQNGDRNPSFSIFAGGTRFKCHGCGLSGDGPDLVELWLNLPHGQGVRIFSEMANGRRGVADSARPVHQARKTKTRERTLKLPHDLQSPSEEELKAIGKQRRVDPFALLIPRGNGTLKVGTVCGYPSWLLTDKRRLIAEARRLDGDPFPASGSLGSRKAHTLSGSRKDWPAGIAAENISPEAVRTIMLVEGTPDALAAYHFATAMGAPGVLPAAILGRSCRNIHPEALELFKGKNVRLYPHNDSDGGGLEAAHRWGTQIQAAGAARCEIYNFANLWRMDGSPVNDLNDCTALDPAQQGELETLIPR
jgi:hypothetical protein